MCHELKVRVIIVTLAILPAILQSIPRILAIPENSIDHCTSRGSKAAEEVHGIRYGPLGEGILVHGSLIERPLWCQDAADVVCCTGVVKGAGRHRGKSLGVHGVGEVQDGEENPAEEHGAEEGVGVGPEGSVQGTPEGDVVPVETDVHEALAGIR